jgi:hypothetical protein
MCVFSYFLAAKSSKSSHSQVVDNDRTPRVSDPYEYPTLYNKRQVYVSVVVRRYNQYLQR